MSLRLAARDARRGGLVIAGAGEDSRRLAECYADVGYQTIVAENGDDLATLAHELAAPVFVLALPDAALTAWTMTGVAAASIVADARATAFVRQPPAIPAILHLDPAAHAALASVFEAARPDLPVHLQPATADGERLLFLRTLRLFSGHAGVRGEV